MDNLFKALADHTRREILKHLKKKDMTAGEIAECFNMTRPSISHHLAILKAADLVYIERRGQFLVYSLNMSVMEEIVEQFFDTFQKKNEKKDEESS